MRYVIFDTETTGLYPEKGDKLVEIAFVEMIDNKLTGNKLHTLLNPKRSIPQHVSAIHGITNDKVIDKPTFNKVANRVIEFVKGAKLIAHNASFDLSFLNHELAQCGYNKLQSYCNQVIDTLQLARSNYKGKTKKFSLDAMCDYFVIDRSKRTLHGALLDCELLYEVYRNMDEDILQAKAEKEFEQKEFEQSFEFKQIDFDISIDLRVVYATDEENEQHTQFIKKLKNEKIN